MAGEGNGVKVDSGELLSVLECSVCCSEYTDPALARCGHTFCRGCIEECVNRNHECPECKKALGKDDIMKNIQIERLQRQIHEQHDKTKKLIVDNILALEGGVLKSPIVSIFQASLKDSLLRFERYCDEAKKELEDGKKRFRPKLLPAKPLGQSQMEAVKAEEAREIASVELKYKQTVDFLMQFYDRYMKDVLPSPAALPLRVLILVPSKGIRLEDTLLRQQGSMRDVRLAVERHFEKLKNPVIKWGGDIQYRVLGPMTRQQDREEDAKADAITIVDEMQPLSNCHIYPGSTIEVGGSITCEGDVPKPCITLRFSKDEKKAYNYYSCETCNLNWVCEPCIQQCHRGHSFKDYLKNHVPGWACCYCLKKACTLPNKNNPLGLPAPSS